MTVRSNVIELAYDDDGLLYAPGIRELVGPSLDAAQLTGYETLMAMGLLWPALRAFDAAVWERYGSEQLKVLSPTGDAPNQPMSAYGPAGGDGEHRR